MGDANHRGTFEERKALAEKEMRPSARRRLNVLLLSQRNNIVKRRADLKAVFFQPDANDRAAEWKWTDTEAKDLYDQLSSMLGEMNKELARKRSRRIS